MAHKDIHHEPIPGELDRSTEAPTQPAIVGTTGYGGDLPGDEGPPIDAQTRRLFEWEGGGKTPMGKRTRPFDERHEAKGPRPGNRPVEQQERDPSQVDKTRPHDRAISGPGASDFLTAQGGEDRPGFSPNKGMADTRGQSALTDPKNLVPRLGPDSEAHPGERKPDENQPGSATGTVGGGGAEAHNSSAVRAAGVDDPSARKSNPAKK